MSSGTSKNSRMVWAGVVFEPRGRDVTEDICQEVNGSSRHEDSRSRWVRKRTHTILGRYGPDLYVRTYGSRDGFPRMSHHLMSGQSLF